MQVSFRSLFRQLISILCCCFLVVAVTGILLGIGDRIIELPNIATQLLIEIHQGAFVGKKLKAIPDSMLRMSQDGMCLSYMPAKEAKYFVFDGDIINKHISEFLAPELVVKLIKATQLSLQTGKTESFQFPIMVDGEVKYHEARVTSIGNSEVLILIRENGSMSVVTSKFSVAKNGEKKLRLLSESKLVRVLETNQSETGINRQQVLMCFAINKTETNTSNDDSIVDDNLLHQIAIQIDMLLISNSIFQLEDNLVILVSNRTMEQAVVLVDELNRDLRSFINNSESDIITAIDIRIGLVEINYDNLDIADLIRGVKATCQMAKHKVNFQTFG